MQYYNNLTAFFETKLNFDKYSLNYLKSFDQKLSLMRHRIYDTLIYIQTYIK